MNKYEVFELKIEGVIAVHGFTFHDADTKFIKAIKAATKTWDIDICCKEHDPKNTSPKIFPLEFKGKVTIEGKTVEDAKELLDKAFRSVSNKWKLTVN